MRFTFARRGSGHAAGGRATLIAAIAAAFAIGVGKAGSSLIEQTLLLEVSTKLVSAPEAAANGIRCWGEVQSGGVMGLPRLVSVHKSTKHSELFAKVWAAVGFYCTDESCTAEEPPFEIFLSDYAGMLSGERIECDDTVLDAADFVAERRALVLVWKPGKYDFKHLTSITEHSSMPKKKKGGRFANNDDGEGTGNVQLYDCLDKYTEAEPMEGFNWECKKCLNTVEPLKTYCIWSCSAILAFQLKRFSFTITENGMQKEKIESVVQVRPFLIPLRLLAI